MIGQDQLLSKLKSYTIDTLPKTLLFLGQSGSGRKTLINEIANNLSLEIVYISEDITAEQIIEYQQSVNKKIYLIDLNLFTEKQQNQFLKLIEEPSNNVYIMLIAESEIGILDTILNRCIKYRMEPYTREQLEYFNNSRYFNEINNKDLIYKLIKTPGDLINLDLNNLTELYNLCNTIVDKLDIATIPNTLSILTKINYAENYNKFDFKLFFNVLLYCAYEKYIKDNNKNALRIYLFTSKYIQDLQFKTLNKENFMINYLLNLKKEVY